MLKQAEIKQATDTRWARRLKPTLAARVRWNERQIAELWRVVEELQDQVRTLKGRR